jgi:hypothetical protein
VIVRELLARVGIDLDEKSVARADSAITKLKHGLEALAGAYGLHKAYEFISGKFEQIAASAEELTHLSEKTGIAVEQLQALQFAAKMTGVDTGELQMALVHLSRSAQEAATTGGSAGAAFYRLGLTVKDATTGKLKPTAQLLGELADKFKAMPDGPEKAAASLELLSRAGANLIPFLNKGSDGLAAMGIEAKKTGAVMSAGLIRQGVELDHSLKRLQATLWGLTISVLGPFVQRMTAGKNSIAAWIQTHRQLIALRVHEVFTTLAGAMKAVFDLAQKFPVVFAGVALALGAIFAPVTTAITLLGLLAEDVYGYFHGRKSLTGVIVNAFKMLGSLIDQKGFFGGLYEGATKFAQWFADTLVRTIGETALRTGLGWLLGPSTPDHVDRGPDNWWQQAIKTGLYGLTGGPPGYVASPAMAAMMATPGGTDMTGAMIFAPQTTIYATTGASADEIADAAARKHEELWDRKMRESAPSGR